MNTRKRRNRKNESARTIRRREERKENKKLKDGHRLVNWKVARAIESESQRLSRFIEVQAFSRENSLCYDNNGTTISSGHTLQEIAYKKDLLRYAVIHEKQYYDVADWYENYDKSSDLKMQWSLEVFEMLWANITADDFNQLYYSEGCQNFLARTEADFRDLLDNFGFPDVSASALLEITSKTDDTKVA
tara:strand:+ start:57 stop:623 length:567 start_codon:yes stop_codon:yes gene_type:complete